MYKIRIFFLIISSDPIWSVINMYFVCVTFRFLLLFFSGRLNVKFLGSYCVTTGNPLHEPITSRTQVRRSWSCVMTIYGVHDCSVFRCQLWRCKILLPWVLHCENLVKYLVLVFIFRLLWILILSWDYVESSVRFWLS